MLNYLETYLMNKFEAKKKNEEKKKHTYTERKLLILTKKSRGA